VRIFLHFLQVSAYNSYVLYRQDKAPTMRFVQYIEILLTEMAIPSLKCARHKVSPEKDAKIAKNEPRYTGFHEPFFHCRHGGETVDSRRRCKISHSRVSSGCIDCNIALCLRNSDYTTSCFKRIHDKSNA